MLPEPLAHWCADQLGPFDLVRDCAHDHGESAVWRIASKAMDESYYLKAHRRDGKREREIWAYRNTAARIPDLAPRLVAIREVAPGALLLSALPGLPMEKVALTPAQEREAWLRAGAALAKMHAITSTWFGRPDRNGAPQDVMESDATTFWGQRLFDWIERAERGNYLAIDEIAFAKAMLENVDVFRGEPAVACHHDYTPRNWIASSETGEWLGVIDFEHSCFDVAVSDFKLYQDRFFTAHPDLKDAFFAGYGKPLTERQEAQLRMMHLHQGVSGVVWSREHNDTAFEKENHAILRRVIQEATQAMGYQSRR